MRSRIVVEDPRHPNLRVGVRPLRAHDFLATPAIEHLDIGLFRVQQTQNAVVVQMHSTPSYHGAAAFGKS
ncbi:MAG: hypothetical protein ACRENA_03810 [Vulcanimicrobiaceae bacterium]